MTGHPTNLTPETAIRLLNELKGSTRDPAVEAAGIDRSTFYRWLKRGLPDKTCN